jgi:hypothetical protein
MRLGCIFECQREGPDILVCRQFLSQLNPKVVLDPVPMDDKANLIERCGLAAEVLLKTNQHVVILWDLIPRWTEGDKIYNLEDELQKVKDALIAAKVNLKHVSLVCMIQELEAWLLADHQAVGAVIARIKRPHAIGSLKKYKNPDSEHRPKKILEKVFDQELGYIYRDHTHALPIAKAVGNDWRRIKKSPSFCRFAKEAAGVVFG